MLSRLGEKDEKIRVFIVVGRSICRCRNSESYDMTEMKDLDQLKGHPEAVKFVDQAEKMMDEEVAILWSGK